MRFLLGMSAAALLALTASAAAQSPPPFSTRKVDGTDNVYIFRYGGHQAMFVVTPEGVIATDPIGYQRPRAVAAYIDEIKKVTPLPIKYVVYSHHHFDPHRRRQTVQGSGRYLRGARARQAAFA